MDSYMTYTLDEIPFFKAKKVDLNFNFSKFDIFLKYFDQFLIENCNKSTVGVGKLNVTNEKVRKSLVLHNIKIYTNFESISPSQQCNQFDTKIKCIIPEIFRELEFNNPFNMGSNYKWEMLYYKQGDFFSRHSDGKSNKRHFCTLLLLPPSNINRYTGGDLILYDGNDKIVIQPNSDKWMLVGFPINVEHESTPVISGRKIIFKTKFEIPKTLYQILKLNFEPRIKSNSSLLDFIFTIENKIKELKFLRRKTDLYLSRLETTCEIHKKYLISENNSISNIDRNNNQNNNQNYDSKISISEIEKSIENNTTTKTNKEPKYYENKILIEKILSSKKRIKFVVLDKKYDTIDPKYLIGEDRDLYMSLYNNFPGYSISLINKIVNQNMEDGDDNRDDEYGNRSPCDYNRSTICFDCYDCNNGLEYNTESYDTFFQTDDYYTMPGKLIKSKLKYNDESYDTVYEFSITAIMMIKVD